MQNDYKPDYKPYYIGLDCGTNSIGYAVTDEKYNLMKAMHKDMWGSHLFDEAATAEARRIQRNARKRLGRRKERIGLLQAIFAEAICKTDPTFFLRLNESGYCIEDRDERNNQKYSLFNDPGFTDKEFKLRYPTMYHLRAALVDGARVEDPRIVYLALHHIIKYRGHFLFPGDSLASVMDLDFLLASLTNCYQVLFDNHLSYSSQMQIKEALRVRKKSERAEKLNSVFFSDDDRRKSVIMKLIAGYSINPKALFDKEEYGELPKLEFQKSTFEEQVLPVLEDMLNPDEYMLVETSKALYDWSLLSNILTAEDSLSISKAKVRQYEKNKSDIDLLRVVIRKYAPTSYEEFFHCDKKGSFSNYIGSINTNKLKKKRKIKRCSTDEFYGEIRKILKNADKEDPDVVRILDDIDNDCFYPLLRSFRNGIIPYQINLADMKAILGNARAYMPWLSEKDPSGFSAEEKIISIMKYRIPYYVGPLTDPEHNQNAWMVRKEAGRIFPWNFEDKVDVVESAEKFVMRMTNKCTYLRTEDVVPKQSLLYQSFMVLNEINKLRFNAEPITVGQKQAIYDELFRKGPVTQGKIKKLALSHGWVKSTGGLSISGLDTVIKSSLSSYIAFRSYLDSGRLSNADVEKIIRWLTLFSDGGVIARNMIISEFKDKLSKNEIDNISRMKFSGWGNLSRKFLVELKFFDPLSGSDMNIMDLLWTTNHNLMEILHKPEYGILERISVKEPISGLDYGCLEDMRIPPKVKRQIWQALKVVKEIEHVMGYGPRKVFIETTREKGEKGRRTKSRKEFLLEKITATGDKELLARLKDEDASSLSKRDKLYLYYTQLGKCMYSKEEIDLDDLLGPCTKYDIDHIYPFSKSNDDSLTNKVIVKSSLNRQKSDSYPLSEDIRAKMEEFWKRLFDLDLIPSEKYHRLVRRTPLSEEDLNGFINRQLVETSQSAVALADILSRYYGKDTRIVYSKAANVSEFRRIFDIPKSRIINHLHHAKDAYLNIVVGNTLAVKYSSAWFLRNVNFNDPYKYNIEGAWVADQGETISNVKSVLAKNTVLFTRQPEMRTGQLFDLNPMPKGGKKGLIPLKYTKKLRQILEADDDKGGVIKAWTDKYGGYSSVSVSHFALIRHMDKKNRIYSFVKIPIIRAEELLHEEALINYCRLEMGLVEPEIIRKKVLFNTLLSVDGFLLTITGTMNAGATLCMESSVPVYFDDETTRYIKKIEKIIEKHKNDRNLVISEEHDGITREKNEDLYGKLIKKSRLQIFKNRPAECNALIEDGFAVFVGLSLMDQVVAIYNILCYFGMNSGLSDFSLIGGSKAQGTLRINSKIDPKKRKVVLIDQSITGIYENRLALE